MAIVYRRHGAAAYSVRNQKRAIPADGEMQIDVLYIHLMFCLILIIRLSAASQKLHSSQSLVVRPTCFHRTDEKDDGVLFVS